MKKIIIITGFSLFMGIGFTSCERCKTCTYTYKDPSTGRIITVDKGEKCGKKSTLVNYENETKGEAAKLGAELTCTDK